MASYISSEMLRVRYITVQEKISGINAVLAENITGARVAKAFARENEQSARFVDRNRQNLDANSCTIMSRKASRLGRANCQVRRMVRCSLMSWKSLGQRPGADSAKPATARYCPTRRNVLKRKITAK